MEAFQIEEPQHVETATSRRSAQVRIKCAAILSTAAGATALVTLARSSSHETAGTLALLESECVDIAGVRTNEAGFGCQLFTDMPEVCNDPGDTSDFTASSLCCACGGGFRPPPSTRITTTTTTTTTTSTTRPTTTESLCRDSNAMAVNNRGYDCLMYTRMPQLCTHTMHDTANFRAQEMCCVCGGGHSAVDQGQGLGHCWGDQDAGGDCNEVDFSDVLRVFSAEEGFVIVGSDGRTQCWGTSFVGQCESVDFSAMTHVEGNRHAVVALDTVTGTGRCWGNSLKGGDCSDISFTGVHEVYSTWEAFLAWDVDAGRGRCWGERTKGGECSEVSFEGVTDIKTTWHAFVAFNRNQGGSGECWGERAYGGECSHIDFSGVTEIYSNRYAFLAVDRNAGTGQCWGDIAYGGLCDWVNFGGGVEVYSNEYAFVVFNRAHGQGECLGDSRRGGSCSRHGIDFSVVTAIFSTNSAFMAFQHHLPLEDSSIPNAQCWGRRQAGGNCSGLRFASDTHIYSTGYAFLAFNPRLGESHCWGDRHYGGDCNGLDLHSVNTVYSARGAFLAVHQSENEPGADGATLQADPISETVVQLIV